MDFSEIEKILALVREHELAEFELERDGLKLRVRKAGVVPTYHPAPLPPGGPMSMTPASPFAIVSAPAQAGAASAAAAAADLDEATVELAVVKSPIVGTFYRSPEPGAASFVEIGQHVKKDQVVCIIEAMKLMNEITSEYDGEIANVYVENGKPVQYGERLFAIRTTDGHR
ncbi:MAG TPA: acetyl-CoA carboxylase biotin carboxyl carrier protein [Vicinamibacterales bacterium]|jgi:acetyl-CoA carboxylase biotin carboxyl carrier protein